MIRHLIPIGELSEWAGKGFSVVFFCRLGWRCPGDGAVIEGRRA